MLLGVIDVETLCIQSAHEGVGTVDGVQGRAQPLHCRKCARRLCGGGEHDVHLRHATGGLRLAVDRGTLMPMIRGIDGAIDKFDESERATITAYLDEVAKVYRAQLP